MTSPRILVSNDDGIEADGIAALAEAMAPLGEVWVVAPDREHSGASHAISLNRPLRVRELGPRRFSVDGTPSDCVYVALNRILRDLQPDIVVSGINHGANLGNDVLYSGTVAAAMEGAVFGKRAIAFSLCDDGHHHNGASHFETAAAFATRLVAQVLAAPPRPGTLLNVNVPNVPLSDIAGYKLCRLGYTDWAQTVDERHDPRGKAYLWIGGERRGFDDVADSDNNAVAANCVAVTPVHYDLTEFHSFDFVRGLRVKDFTPMTDTLGSGPLNRLGHPRAMRVDDESNH